MGDTRDDSVGNGPRSETEQTRRAFLTGTVTAGGVVASLSNCNAAAGAEAVEGKATVNPRLFTFVGGKKGGWSVISVKAVVGDPLPVVERLDIINGAVATLPDGGKWMLRGVTSNDRYVTRDEKDRLIKKQAALGRPDATQMALIPIRKSAKWWALTQDERRALFEEKSRHITIGLKYLPGVARRLHHCRDLGESEPFDFLTLFDFAKSDAKAFDNMVAELRATAEWKFVEREVDIRLERVR
jgi:hypothetical protein